MLSHSLLHPSSRARSHLPVICFIPMLDYSEATGTTKFGSDVKHTDRFLISLGSVKNWGVFLEIKQ